VWRFFQAGVNVSDGSDESSPWRRNPALTGIEADRITLLPSVRYVTRRDESSATVGFADLRLESVEVSGLSAQWVEVNGGDVYPGRTFTRLEIWRAARWRHQPQARGSAVPRPRSDRPDDPHCRSAVHRDRRLHAAASLFSGSTPPFVGIPHGAFVKYVPYFKGMMRLAVAPGPGYTQQQSMDEVIATLRSLRGLKPGQENNFSIVTQTSCSTPGTRSPECSSS